VDLVMRSPAPIVLALLCALAGVAYGPTAAAVNQMRFCGMERWQSIISAAAERFGLPPAWLGAVIEAESAGCTSMNGRPTTSRAGAIGLMQLMPVTWLRYQRRLGLGTDPYDPHDNILAGAAYLRELYDRYGIEGFLAAYQAGPTRYEEYLVRSRALPAETLDYIARVRRFLKRIGPSSPALPAPHSHSVSPLFVTRGDRRRLANRPETSARESALFVPLNRADLPAQQQPADLQDGQLP
jgi:soluble lytic murein transglycosylase-like protein